MYAKIINKQSPYYGQTLTIQRIAEDHQVRVFIHGDYVDFAMSEVKMTGTARLGKAILDTFAEGQDCILRNGDIRAIARRAAAVWPCTIKCCESAIHEYVWN